MGSALLLMALVSPALAAEPPTKVGSLVITEFMAQLEPASGIPDYDGEWFEIRNASDVALDLDGLLVRGEEGEVGFQVNGELILDPGQHWVFGVNDDTAANGGVPVDYVYTQSNLPLEHTGDTLRLVYGTTTIDRVDWSPSTGWSVTASMASMQVNLNADDNEWANGLPQNWCPSTTSIGVVFATPGAENVYCGDASDDDDVDGYSIGDGDCNDDDADVHPGLIDGIESPHGVEGDDRNCDGVRDDGIIDDDGDGWNEVDGDCDDTEIDLNPDVLESNDGIDNDCNGCIDDFDDDGDDWTECWTGEVLDCDTGDGLDCSVFEVTGTVGSDSDPPRFVLDDNTFDLFVEGACALAFDQDDEEPSGEDPSRFPCAEEVAYDGIDQSGDGYDFCDRDYDGFPGIGCVGAPSPGFSQVDVNGEPVAEDCDDTDDQAFPGGDEGDPQTGGVADGVDNDCNGIVDDPFLDLDGDGVSTLEGDCRDALLADDPLAADVFPGADEVCGDHIDNDCNGLADDGCSEPASLGSLGGGGLCGTVGASGAGGLALLAFGAALLIRRREDRC